MIDHRGSTTIRRTALAALLFAAAATGCASGGSGDAAVAGDIPDTQVFVPFNPPTAGFTVNVPEGWARADAGGAVTFSDKFNSVRIETMTTATAPTVQSETGGPQGGKVTAVTRAGGPAVLIAYQIDGAPDPVTGKAPRLDVQRYEFWRAGTEVVLTLSGAAGSDNVDPWRTISDSFRWA